MTHQFVFLNGRPEPLYGDDKVNVVETYNFGDDVGSAAKVETDDSIDSIDSLDADDVVGIEDDTVEFEVRTEANVQGQNVATIEDVQSLHNVPEAGNRGKDVRVVVMDSGIDTEHPLFNRRDIPQADVTGNGQGDDVGHGTAVAGQIVRLAPEVDITSLRIFGDSGRTSFDTILRAYEWLFAHADEYDVVNMSWGASRKVQQLDDIHNQLVEKGVRDVVAAGNSGGPGGSPATAEKAFSVGACTQDGAMAPFSSHDKYDNPEITAIGVNNRLAQARGTIMGDNLTGQWVKASGTSFAAPEAAGSVARFLETHSVDEVRPAYEANADDLKGTERDGKGLMNHSASMREPPEEPKPPEADATAWTLWDEGNDILYINDDWLTDGEYRVAKLEDESGRLVLELREQ